MQNFLSDFVHVNTVVGLHGRDDTVYMLHKKQLGECIIRGHLVYYSNLLNF